MKLRKMPFILVPFFFLSVWSCTRYPMGQSGPYGGHMMGYGFGGIFMWLIFLALAGFIVYIFVMQSRRSGESGGQPKQTPLDILRKRYAKGDITKEEFENLKKDIEK